MQRLDFLAVGDGRSSGDYLIIDRQEQTIKLCVDGMVGTFPVGRLDGLIRALEVARQELKPHLNTGDVVRF